MQAPIIYFYFLSFNRRTGLFFWLRRTVALTHIAAVGLLCVGFWRRVGVSAVLNKAYGNPKKPQQQWNKTTIFKDFKSYLFT
jgi:hypothetical protein